MASKITDYPAKTTFNDGDLYDVSTFDGATTYTSEKMTFTQLKANLNTLYNLDGSLTSARTVTLTSANTLTFDGGLTTFKGEDLLSTTFSIKALNSDSSKLLSFSNDGVLYSGRADLTNYFKNELNWSKQFSSTGTSKLLAEADTGTIALNAGTSIVQYLQFTGNLELTKFDGSESGNGITEKWMELRTNTIYLGDRGGTDTTVRDVVMTRFGVDATSAASQKDSRILKFQNSLWDGAVALTNSFDLESKASTSVNEEATWQLSHGATDLFGVRNDGVVLMTSLPTSSAGLPSGALWNNSNVLNIV